MLYIGSFSIYGGETKTGTPRVVESFKRGLMCGFRNDEFHCYWSMFLCTKGGKSEAARTLSGFYSFAMIETSLACE